MSDLKISIVVIVNAICILAWILAKLSEQLDKYIPSIFAKITILMNTALLISWCFWSLYKLIILGGG